MPTAGRATRRPSRQWRCASADLTDATALTAASNAAAAAAAAAPATAAATDAAELALISNADAAAAATAQSTADATDAVALTVTSDAAVAAALAAHQSPITVDNFDAGPLANGGDIIDMSGIAGLSDSVATGVGLGSDFGPDNVFVFDATPVTIDAAAAAIALDASVTASQGYIVIKDADNADLVTVYHSTDLNANGAETALALLSGVNISNLVAANFIV